MLLNELSWTDVRELLERDGKTVVIVPTGSTEQHGPALPLQMDITAAYDIAVKVGERTGALVAPPLNFGYSMVWARYPGTISFRATTFLSAVEDICESLIRGGFKKIFIFNGHGGNPYLLKAAADVVIERHGKDGVEVAVRTYWAPVDTSLDEIGLNWKDGTHANECETSLMLALRPGLVKFDLIKDWEKRYKYREITAQLDGGLIVGEPPDPDREPGIWGDPSKASPEKGKAYFEAIVERVSDFVTKFKRGDYPASRWE